jgi:hypothetical protein
MEYHRLSQRVNNMAVFLVFWISLAVNPTKFLKKVVEKGYCCFFGSFAILFMQLLGLLLLLPSTLVFAGDFNANNVNDAVERGLPT